MLIRGGIDHSNISTLSRSVSRTKTISNYIDSILSLIPSKQYHGNDTPDVSGTHDSIDLAREGKYAKRKKNPYPEQERKESSKKGLKRARSESGFEENTEGATEGGGGGESTQTVSHSSSGISTDTQHKKVVVASSIDELRARLHARIEELRSKRGDAKKGEKEGGDSKKEERGRSAIEESKKGGDSQQAQSLMKKTSSHIPQQQQQQKLKGSSQSQAFIGAGGITGHVESGRSSSSSSATAMLSKSLQSSSHLAKKSLITASSAQTQVHRNPHGSLSSIPGQSLQTTTSAMASTSSSGKVQLPSSSSSSSGLDVAFGQLSTSLPAALAVSTLSIKPTKASKEGRMRDQLKKAVKYKESLASLAQQGEEGVQKKISLEFNHALSRAQGEKVHDDPTLLAKALKRRKKEKSKSHADWNTRKSKEKAEMKDRQVERNKNLNNKKNRALKRGDRPAPTSSGAGSGGGGGGGGEKEGTSSRPSPSQNRPGFEGRFGK